MAARAKKAAKKKPPKRRLFAAYDHETGELLKTHLDTPAVGTNAPDAASFAAGAREKVDVVSYVVERSIRPGGRS